MNKLLTVAQVAEQLGISESLVYAWAESGALPHYRFGRNKRRGKIMVDPDELATFIAAMKVQGQQEAAPQPPTPRPASASAPASSGSRASPFSELKPERLRKAWRDQQGQGN